jgi:hypothetical protein
MRVHTGRQEQKTNHVIGVSPEQRLAGYVPLWPAGLRGGSLLQCLSSCNQSLASQKTGFPLLISFAP